MMESNLSLDSNEDMTYIRSIQNMFGKTKFKMSSESGKFSSPGN